MTEGNIELKNSLFNTIIKNRRDKNILVIGDIMLDHYIWGSVERISPEAPVPVVRLETENYRLGGAGNVAHNLSSLGLKTSIMSVIGEDTNGDILSELLLEANIDQSSVYRDGGRPTTTKTRIIAHNQQVVRIDRESSEIVNDEVYKKFEKYLENHVNNFDALIISDYNKGVVTRENIGRIISICNANNIPVAVDPKKHDLLLYNNSFIITPNLKEFEQFAGQKLSTYDIESIKKHSYSLLERSNIQNLLITLGEAGMMLLSKDQAIPCSHIRTKAKSVFDVTGAGDTVIASFMAFIACGMDILSSARFADISAGIVIRKVGTSPITLDDLIEYFNGEK